MTTYDDDAWMADPTDGAGLLDDVRAALVTYCAMPSREHTDAVVLRIAATHSVSAFDYATRLVIRSAEKRSGKSRLLEVIDATCHRPKRQVRAATDGMDTFGRQPRQTVPSMRRPTADRRPRPRRLRTVPDRRRTRSGSGVVNRDDHHDHGVDHHDGAGVDRDDLHEAAS